MADSSEIQVNQLTLLTGPTLSPMIANVIGCTNENYIPSISKSKSSSARSAYRGHDLQRSLQIEGSVGLVNHLHQG